MIQSNQQKIKIYFLLSFILLSVCIFYLIIGHDGLINTDLLCDPKKFYLIKYRLNRLLMAIIAGSSLAACGASLQALFKNPLSDPHIFGISAGASLGACIVIAYFSSYLFLMPKIGAIIGGSISFLFIFYFFKKNPQANLNQCLLIGILVNSLASAIITILKLLISQEKTQNLLFWMVGNLSTVENLDFLFIIPLWAIGMSSLLKIKKELDILAFGKEEAILLGIDHSRVSQVVIISNCILIGNTVSFAGMIGFVGLIVPHLIRWIFWPKYSLLLPLSMLLGAIVLVFFDALSRLSFWFFSTEIPVGALCALFLSPLFFILLLKSSNHDNFNN